MGPEVVFAVYRPNQGKREELLKLVQKHVPTLRRLGLATDRPEILVSAIDGTFIEVFEWKSNEAARMAHEHPEVAKIWEAMGAIGSFLPLAEVSETKKAFCHFTPVNLT